MPSKKNPRRGSMQFWPRKRAAKIVSRIRSWAGGKEPVLQGFAGYKVGMTHVMAKDTSKTTPTKGEQIQVPVTVVECPPIKIISILLYQNDLYGTKCSGQINAPKLDKELAKKICLPKKSKDAKTENLSDVRVLAMTQPKLTCIGKKKPELFELGLGGSVDEKLAKAKEMLGKEVPISEVFKVGDVVDAVSVTKGHGLQGPVKRFGVKIRFHKSEKTKRGPGSLGPWTGARTYRVAHAGQTGYHQRREFNKQILVMSKEADKINPKGGFLRYGNVKNEYLLVRGSLGGPSKRLITFMAPQRKYTKSMPEISYISQVSHQ